MQSIGERLEEARKQRGITVREASETIKIRGEYLNNFESNIFKMNLPDIYVRGFLRSYADYLRVNSDKVITDYNAHLIGENKSSRRDTREFLGRLELQQPLVPDEGKNLVDDDAIESNEEVLESQPIWERLLEKLNLEKDVAIKMGIASGLALILIIVVVWGFLAFLGSDEPEGDTSLTETTVTAPAANATAFTLIANDDVRVEVNQIDGDIPLFFAVLPQGQEKELSAVGSIRVNYSDADALSIRIGTKTYKMQSERSSIRITPSNIIKQQ